MSELMNARMQNGNVRYNLLAHTSMFALLGYLGMSQGALAASADVERPTIWVELGGQFERVDSAQTILAPTFFNLPSEVDLDAMTAAQRMPPTNIGGEGKMTIEPENTNWVLSAAIRYGRSSSSRHLHEQTAGHKTHFGTLYGKQKYTVVPPLAAFSDGQSHLTESHFLLDFQAGKDVGVGMFGAGGKSVFSAGLRFAQFTSRSEIALHARLNYDTSVLSSPGVFRAYRADFRNYTAVLNTDRDTHAIGPLLSWDASAPIARSDQNMTVTLDWGVNAAILFGRQRTVTHHQTSGSHHSGFIATIAGNVTGYVLPPVDKKRSRTVTIPNLGGFAGITFKKSITKINLGYRADFFFGAVDGGIDTAKKENVGFYGPFATISIGIGG